MSKFNHSRCALMTLNVVIIVLSLSMLLATHLYSKNHESLKNIPLGELIEWIGDSASRIDRLSDSYTNAWWASTRCLIFISILGYFLALCGLVGVGLEHLSLLLTLCFSHILIFSASLSGLIFSLLNEKQWSFGCSTLAGVFIISALQLYITGWLVYELIQKRRRKQSYSYSLAKMLPNA